jgi:mannose-1-phosphate guanylyltransferase
MGRNLRSFPQDRWGVILAGGDGVRLRPLTRIIAGDDRPKQFCPILGQETLLSQTVRRVGLAISAGRTLVVVTRAHERYYSPLLADRGPLSVVIQPENRGTAPAILYALLRIAAVAPMAWVALFPSDHYVSDDRAFMIHVDAAFEALSARPDLVALLGIRPDRPEVEYGWIEPGGLLAWQQSSGLYSVRRFWEKPSAALAERLLAQGCLWNSFVMVGRVPTLLWLIDRAAPDLSRVFAEIQPALGTSAEEAAVRSLYARLPEVNFSRQVLTASPANLAVVPMAGVRWSDWGDPGRVLTTLAHIGIRPAWAGTPSLLPV